MGDNYTIDEFSCLSKRAGCLWECFRHSGNASSPASSPEKT
jgi:hypothetical protein